MRGSGAQNFNGNLTLTFSILLVVAVAARQDNPPLPRQRLGSPWVVAVHEMFQSGVIRTVLFIVRQFLAQNGQAPTVVTKRIALMQPGQLGVPSFAH